MQSLNDCIIVSLRELLNMQDSHVVHVDVIKWKHFPRHPPVTRRFNVFFYLHLHRAHYDVTVMSVVWEDLRHPCSSRCLYIQWFVARSFASFFQLCDNIKGHFLIYTSYDNFKTCEININHDDTLGSLLLTYSTLLVMLWAYHSRYMLFSTVSKGTFTRVSRWKLSDNTRPPLWHQWISCPGQNRLQQFSSFVHFHLFVKKLWSSHCVSVMLVG